MTFAERHDRAVLYATAGLIALLPILATLAHRGYGAALLLAGTIIATQPHVWKASVARFLRPPERGDFAALSVWCFAAFSAWLLASGLWSEVRRPWKVWADFTFTALAAGALCFEVLRRSSAPRDFSLLAGAFVVSAAASVVLLGFEGATGGALRAALPPHDPDPARAKDFVALARGLSAVIPSLFAAAAVCVLRQGKLDVASRLALGGGASLAAFAASTNSVTANVVALGAGALAWLAAQWAPKTTLRGFGVLILALTLAAPLAAFLPASRIAAQTHLETSWAQRLFIFRKGGEAAIACAPLGCGADYGRALSRQNEVAQLPGDVLMPVMPLHPHNVFLQVWMDLGVPGAALFAASALFGFFALARLNGPRIIRAAIAGSAASILVSALIEASLWQNWRVAAAGFAACGVALSYGFHRLHLNSANERIRADSDQVGDG